MIKKITIEIVPHLSQRYNTVGDWQFTRDAQGDAIELNVKVSDTDERDGNMLIAIHEMVEAILCELGGVAEEAVDKFDMEWIPRPAWWNSDTLFSEPGEDPSAPYYSQHQLAAGIERIVATRLYTNWERYEAKIDELIKRWEGHFAVERKEVEMEQLKEVQPATPPSPDPDFPDDIPF